MEVEHDGADLRRAELLLDTGRFAEARALARSCAAGRPGDPSPLLVAAMAELELDEVGAAESTARQAIGLDPARPASHRVLARVLMTQALAKRDVWRADTANRAYHAAHEAARLAPGDVHSLLVVAEAAAMCNRFDAAVRAVDDAVARAPDLPTAWLVRARVARLARNFGLAEASAREALRLRPDHYGAGNELGLILQAQGRHAEARQQFASSAAIDPIASPARVNLLGTMGPALFAVFAALTSPILLLGLVAAHEDRWLVAWLVAALAAHIACLRWPRTRRAVERRALLLARRAAEGQPSGHRGLRRADGGRPLRRRSPERRPRS